MRRNVDRWLLLAVGGLMACSLVAIHSASQGGTTGAVRQGIYFAIGLGLMAYVATRDYGKVVRYTGVLYWVNIALLIAVKVLSPDVKGAQRWIPLPIPGMDFKLQPSEFAKVIIILTLSAYVVRLGDGIRQFPNLLKTLVHVGIPMGLIMKQPDLGTSLVFAAIWLGIVFLGGARGRHLLGLILAGAVLFGVAWQGNVLKEYQKDRVRTFLNPTADAQGDGYHVLQSMKAIGGGRVSGQGLGNGLQNKGQLVPENHTDFIFTVVGEETGFVGACALLGMYGVLLWRGLAAIADSADPLGRLIAGGVVTLFTFHVLVNIGMTCGIMPVVGVPLPLMSFGGSAAWASLTAIGLLLSIHLRRTSILPAFGKPA